MGSNNPKESCGVCGVRGKRACPALSGSICPTCCASKRGSAFNCPSHCPYFPFGGAAYDEFYKVRERWNLTTAKYVVTHFGRDRVNAEIKKYSDTAASDITDDVVSDFALEQTFTQLLFNAPGDDGKTLARTWSESGWTGMTNDEIVMTRYRENSCVTLVEIQKVIDSQTLEYVDLLEPGKNFLVLDRLLAKTATRFDRALVRLTHYPHFSKFGGSGYQIPFDVYPVFRLELDSRLARAQEREPDLTLKEYLRRRFLEVASLPAQIGREQMQRMLNKMDSHQCIATYAIAGDRADVLAVLDSKPDFERNEDGDRDGGLRYEWLRRGESKKIEAKMLPAFRHDDESQGVGTLGTVMLHPDKVVVETMTKQKFAFAKKMVKKYFGTKLRLENEAVLDLAKIIAGKMDAPDSDPRPAGRSSDIPKDVEEKLLNDYFQNSYKKFLYEPIPALMGKTPREASKNRNMRFLLLDLIKGHLHNMENQNREKGFAIDISWIVDELGLTELK